MSDIVEELRERAYGMVEYLMLEAADEIERLRRLEARINLIDDTDSVGGWVQCGNGRTDDSIVTPSASVLVAWIRQTDRGNER